MDCHYFPLSVALLDRPLQCFIFAISLPLKQLRYLQHEETVHSVPFSRIIRITTPTPNDASSPLPSLSLCFALHVVGTRLGDTEVLLHHTASPQMRDGLLSLLTHLITPHLPPPMPSFYPASLAVLHSSPAYKKGKWGTDAARWMALMEGGRLLLYRGVGAKDPLTCVMCSEVVGLEKKGKKRLRVRGGDREWELGFDGEPERDDWYRRIVAERERIRQAADEWVAEAQTRKAKGEEEERKSVNWPTTPQSASSSSGDMSKRRTVPTPTFFVTAQVALTKAKAGKRSSLSIKTRHSPPPLPQSVTTVGSHTPTSTTPTSNW